jgi:hypothetical protein
LQLAIQAVEVGIPLRDLWIFLRIRLLAVLKVNEEEERGYCWHRYLPIVVAIAQAILVDGVLVI